MLAEMKAAVGQPLRDDRANAPPRAVHFFRRECARRGMAVRARVGPPLPVPRRIERGLAIDAASPR
jgi:hypothetical protein